MSDSDSGSGSDKGYDSGHDSGPERPKPDASKPDASKPSSSKKSPSNSTEKPASSKPDSKPSPKKGPAKNSEQQTPKARRTIDTSKRAKKRKLVRWTNNMDIKLLTTLHKLDKSQKFGIDWDEVGQEIGPTVSGNAVDQHLDKLRKKIEKSEQHAGKVTKPQLQPTKYRGKWSASSKAGFEARQMASKAYSTTPDDEEDPDDGDPDDSFGETKRKTRKRKVKNQRSLKDDDDSDSEWDQPTPKKNKKMALRPKPAKKGVKPNPNAGAKPTTGLGRGKKPVALSMIKDLDDSDDSDVGEQYVGAGTDHLAYEDTVKSEVSVDEASQSDYEEPVAPVAPVAPAAPAVQSRPRRELIVILRASPNQLWNAEGAHLAALQRSGNAGPSFRPTHPAMVYHGMNNTNNMNGGNSVAASQGRNALRGEYDTNFARSVNGVPGMMNDMQNGMNSLDASGNLALRYFNGLPNGMPDGMSNGMPNGMNNGMPNGMNNGMPNGMNNGMQRSMGYGQPQMQPSGDQAMMPPNLQMGRPALPAINTNIGPRTPHRQNFSQSPGMGYGNGTPRSIPPSPRVGNGYSRSPAGYQRSFQPLHQTPFQGMQPMNSPATPQHQQFQLGTPTSAGMNFPVVPNFSGMPNPSAMPHFSGLPSNGMPSPAFNAPAGFGNGTGHTQLPNFSVMPNYSGTPNFSGLPNNGMPSLAGNFDPPVGFGNGAVHTPSHTGEHGAFGSGQQGGIIANGALHTPSHTGEHGAFGSGQQGGIIANGALHTPSHAGEHGNFGSGQHGGVVDNGASAEEDVGPFRHDDNDMFQDNDDDDNVMPPFDDDEEPEATGETEKFFRDFLSK